MASVKIPRLKGPVGKKPRSGKGAPVKNNPVDVKLVQDLLNGAGIKAPTTGKMDNKTLEAIAKFQKTKLKFKHPDGVVDVGMKTYKGLVKLGGAKMGGQKKDEAKDIDKDKANKSKDKEKQEKEKPVGNFTVVVKRGEKAGKLTCSGAKISTTCWWDMNNKKGRIPAGTYKGCSATQMATKKYDAIFIPNVSGWKGIFIHQGKGPKASKGCIVIAKSEMMKLHGKLYTKGGKNVTVKVIDV
ncbi:MAG: DUF5675 family protein [Planctomycetota bacterium]|nr:DUF5675 family protein [Planctomycetota bacterium]